MYSLNFFSGLALIFGAVNASPIGENADSSALDRRAVVDCGGGYKFLSAAQNKGYNDAINHITSNTFVNGKNGKDYPEYFGNMPPISELPANCTTNYNGLSIYPVFVQNTTTFTDGMSPGQDRVVISRHIDGTHEHCGLITHRGAAKGQFKWCGIQ